jgi:hypothetical protein
MSETLSLAICSRHLCVRPVDTDREHYAIGVSRLRLPYRVASLYLKYNGYIRHPFFYRTSIEELSAYIKGSLGQSFPIHQEIDLIYNHLTNKLVFFLLILVFKQALNNVRPPKFTTGYEPCGTGDQNIRRIKY